MENAPSFWQLTAAEVLKKLETTPEGLTQREAKVRERLQRRENAETPRWQREAALLLSQFSNPLVLLLAIAAGLSAFLGEETSVFIILAMLLGTGLLGFFQERNAGRTIEKLRSMLATHNRVLRQGREHRIPAKAVVRGDMLLLQAGDLLPADCYLLESNDLYVNESVLTGESFPAAKQPGVVKNGTDLPLSKIQNALWQGSSVVSGTARAVAVRTGRATLLHDIAARSAAGEGESAYERGLRRFGHFLLQITLVFSLAVLVVNVWLGKSLTDSVLFALALSVGFAPELLPAIMAISMARGAQKMAEEKVVVRKLAAIQNLGEVNLLCCDKTGTLTEGEVRIAGMVNARGEPSTEVALYAWLNSTFESGYPNPIDQAIRQMERNSDWRSVAKSISGNNTPAGSDPQTPADFGFEKLDEIPYDFIRKRLSIVAKNAGGETMLITKGAVENVLECCVKTGGLKTALAHYRQFSQRGLRTLGVAVRKNVPADCTQADERDMAFLGFVLLEDPLKRDVQDSLAALRASGVGVKIITGDNEFVAGAIARRIELDSPNLLTGPDLHRMTDDVLVQKCASTAVFAEVEPHQKERIVRAMQRAGFTVAYLGDGINDVPALRAADVGISTQNAVEVAKAAADIVLLERHLGVLTDGIRLGRRAFFNSLKYIYITNSATFGNMLSLSAASVLLPFIPMLPAQVLLTNFYSDFPFLAVAADRVDDEQLNHPQRWHLPRLRRFMLVFGLHSALFDMATFALFYAVFRAETAEFRSAWFVESVLTEILIIYVVRSYRPFWQSRPAPVLAWFGLAAAILTVGTPYLPFAKALGFTALPFRLLAAALGIVSVYILTADWLKQWFFKGVTNKVSYP